LQKCELQYLYRKISP